MNLHDKFHSREKFDHAGAISYKNPFNVHILVPDFWVCVYFCTLIAMLQKYTHIHNHSFKKQKQTNNNHV